ncbi:MAG: cell division protein FtsL [Anaerosomatales bacterium]|nr:cell division protein FtsL [Anaerosomatales bacterium]
MAQAARKLSGGAVAARPHLRLVRAAPRASASSRARSSSASGALLRVAVAAMIVLAAVGMTRVALAVQAAEASIDASDIRADIAAQEELSKRLEADRSALAAPSRIESIASASLNMNKPSNVCYLELPVAEASGGRPAAGDPVAADTPADDGTLARAVSTVMDVFAGEAQVLLVGDVGLASAK